jgi:hypothetical protein
MLNRNRSGVQRLSSSSRSLALSSHSVFRNNTIRLHLTSSFSLRRSPLKVRSCCDLDLQPFVHQSQVLHVEHLEGDRVTPFLLEIEDLYVQE